MVVRPRLHRPCWAAALAALALWGCATPDASRLEQVVEGPGLIDAGHKDSAMDAAHDAGSPDAGAPPDAGPRGDGGECAADDEFPECTRPQALSVCSDGRCLVVRCEGDFVDCDGNADNGCEATLDSLDNCGLCRAECRFPNALASCELGDCQPAGCEPGFGNCDDDDDNGCEAALNTAERCGACTTACPAPDHGQPACVNGACGLGGCATGFGDCNESAVDGCEQPLNDALHCGGCNTACAPANATGDCSSGSCHVLACDGGFVDCNGLADDGCETPDAAAQNCCAAGSANCDGSPTNGCEASFDQVRTCGTCSNDCLALPHVKGAGCNQGACNALVCDAGWADCDGLATNGCERSTHTLTDCGACNTTCAPAHASASCSTGTCTLTGCDNGYDNCNGNAGDGCEASLSQPTTCGSCTNACPGSSGCSNGSCRCTANSDCSGGKECCDGVCQDTRGSCFPWPCIPGTATGKSTNCGGCGTVCGLWCCL